MSEDEKVAADRAEQTEDDGVKKVPTPGMSFGVGLKDVEDSPVPGAEHSHVHGPQQAAVDPVAAGLDTEYDQFRAAGVDPPQPGYSPSAPEHQAREPEPEPEQEHHD